MLGVVPIAAWTAIRKNDTVGDRPGVVLYHKCGYRILACATIPR